MIVITRKRESQYYVSSGRPIHSGFLDARQADDVILAATIAAHVDVYLLYIASWLVSLRSIFDSCMMQNDVAVLITTTR
mgnify:CR=1 FL=1